ncbi:MAG TPA: DUF4032 domain-containing protein [Anaerolineales bacterium]|nr:DUF4032 domain-containing protein [Anaerolineales bacterium]
MHHHSIDSEPPDFSDLPWHLPLEEWADKTSRLEELPRGESRHPVVFVNYSSSLYAIKEMPGDLAESEYKLLVQLETANIQSVTPVGWRQSDYPTTPRRGLLITRYLDHSIPFRTLFRHGGLERYRKHLLDAIAGLLVQLHLAGVFWGDCSLSNTLFRRDAGTLQAYLVDAETAEIHPKGLTPELRHLELEIMEENIGREMGELFFEAAQEGYHPVVTIPPTDAGMYIRLSYQNLWEEVRKEIIIKPGENYRIQERIRTLNELGFSVSAVEMVELDSGSQVILRPTVTDRTFHRDQLLSLTGQDTEEMQARKMMNEIMEIQGTLSTRENRSVPLNVAAYHWLNQIYSPTVAYLRDLVDENTNEAELYCEVLENKWYLSEQAHHDVGHDAAAVDYVRRFSTSSA